MGQQNINIMVAQLNICLYMYSIYINSVNPGLPRTSQPPSVSDKPTVFLDLRPSSNAALSSAGQGSSAELEVTREE